MYHCDHSVLNDVNPLVVAFIHLLYLIIIKVTVMTEQCRADSALTRDVVCLLTLQAQAAWVSSAATLLNQPSETPHHHHHKTALNNTRINTHCKLCLNEMSGGIVAGISGTNWPCLVQHCWQPTHCWSADAWLLWKRTQFHNRGASIEGVSEKWWSDRSVLTSLSLEGCGRESGATLTASQGCAKRRSRFKVPYLRQCPDNEQVST